MGQLNQNSGYGQALFGQLTVPALVGRTMVVVNSSDNNIDELQQLFDVDGFGEVRYFTSIASAASAMDTNRNDTMILNNHNAHAVTSMVDFSISRSHIWGLDYLLGNVRYQGARSRITMGVTTAATDIANFKNTGVGNSFKALKFDNANTVDEGLYSFAEGGEYAYFSGCEFFKSTDLDETAAAEILMNGDSPLFEHCSFGSTANIIADNKIRANVLLTATLSGKKCRDAVFDDCLFLSKAGGTEHVAVYGANATDVERMLLIKNSTFLNSALSAATPAHAVGFGAAQTQGSVILKNCTSVDNTVMAEASVGIFVDGAVPTFATTGVSKSA
jgi:hypothetical protein